MVTERKQNMIFLPVALILLFLPQYTELIIWLGFGSSVIILIAGIIYLNTGKRLMKSITSIQRSSDK
jgi:hypothetical protein